LLYPDEQERQGLWLPKDDLEDSSSWSSSPLVPVGKTVLLTGLLTGMQDWKCPVALSQTCYGSKSLKVILMDSNFGGHPALKPLVTL